LLGDLPSSADEQLTIPVNAELFDALREGIQQVDHDGRPDVSLVTEPVGLKLVDDGATLQVTLLGKADSAALVASAERQLEQLEIRGGKLIRVSGRCPLPVAMAIAHRLAHLYGAVAIRDPKLNGYVVAISHTPECPVGKVIQ